jgi:PAS domain S-box-containing protein
MVDQDKTREQLISELEACRKRVSELEAAEVERARAEAALRESEHRLELALGAAELGLYDYNVQTGKAVWNDRLYELLGYTPGDVEPSIRTWKRMVHPDDWPHVSEALNRHLDGLAPFYESEYRSRSRSGELKRLLSRGKVVERDHTGKPLRIMGTILDMTDRRKAEEETKRLKNLLSSIVEYLPTPVFLKDAQELRYILWNRACRDVYGYPSEDVIGKTVYDLFPTEQADTFCAQDRQALASGTLVCIPEQMVGTKCNGLRIIHSKKLPILAEDGTPEYVLAISEDITDRKRAEKELVEAREAAEKASGAKSEFLANMSHEIRTPINGIMGMTELALNTELTPEQHEYLEAVRVSADSLLKLINDILDFSKIEAGKLELIEVPFGLRDAISDTMTILAVQAHNKNLELLCHVHPEIPEAVIGDPGRLRQILVNLVGNAIKFTDRGEVVVSVESTSEISTSVDLHFKVADTGIGIPSDKQAKIFRAFEQADGSTSRQYGGTGLGLAISSRFCQMMGGNIWVESEVGKGSTFHFTIRLNLQSEHLEQPVADEVVDLKGLSVLVVDDNFTNRQILEQLLIYWGMVPTVVDSGQAALSALNKAHQDGTPFPIVITDCMMPGMDGFELVECINSTPNVVAPTIVMLTSSGERGHASRCLQLGIAAYLLKPVKQSELLFTLSRVLKGSVSDQNRPSLITRHSIRESKRRLNILLAEDNAVNQKLATKMLERMGHTVTVACNGREALEILNRANFDLILMDVQMPEMDGLDATRTLRELEKPKGAHVPVIALTAHAMERDKERCLEAGMDAYISKPITAQDLYETIEHIMQSREREVQPIRIVASPTLVLNKAEVLERAGGDAELLQEIIALFLNDCPALLSEIRNAYQQRDPERLERAAHTLKGSVSNFAAEGAVNAALALENIGRNRDLSDTAAAIMHLEKEIERVREELIILDKETGP